MKQFHLFIILCALTINTIGQKNTSHKIEKIFNKEVKKKNVHNAFLKIYSPSKDIDLTYFYGVNKSNEEVNSDTPFYTASIGKTFTAVSIAVLKEKGKLNFNDKITLYLPDSITNQLHIYKGIDYSDSLTIEHLLNHTSGLPDYFEGKTTDGSPNLMELIISQPNKTWTPIEMINFSKAKMQPLFKPGNGFNYTDTEYILLGLIIESVSKTSLYNYFQDNIFSPLSLNNTYLNLYSPNQKYRTTMTEMYAGDLKVSDYKSLSADWAGGGIISSTNDLIKFNEALVNGRIVSKQTYNKMQNWINETKGMYYGYGLRKIVFKELFPTLPPLTIIGHNGANGSFMFYSLELDTYITGTVNQLEEYKSSIMLVVQTLMVINKNL